MYCFARKTLGFTRKAKRFTRKAKSFTRKTISFTRKTLSHVYNSDLDVSCYGDEAHRNDISIYPVCLPNRVDSTQLERLVSYSQQLARSWALPDFTS